MNRVIANLLLIASALSISGCGVLSPIAMVLEKGGPYEIFANEYTAIDHRHDTFYDARIGNVITGERTDWTRSFYKVKHFSYPRPLYIHAAYRCVDNVWLYQRYEISAKDVGKEIAGGYVPLANCPGKPTWAILWSNPDSTEAVRSLRKKHRTGTIANLQDHPARYRFDGSSSDWMETTATVMGGVAGGLNEASREIAAAREQPQQAGTNSSPSAPAAGAQATDPSSGSSSNSTGRLYYVHYYTYCDFNADTDEERKTVTAISQIKPLPGSENGLTSDQSELAARKIRQRKPEDAYGRYVVGSGRVSGELINCALNTYASMSDAQAAVSKLLSGSSPNARVQIVAW